MINGPIAVVAPCHAYDESRLDAGLTLVRRAGFTLELLPDLLQPHRYFAAPLEHRARQLLEALTDPRYAAVWFVRGGSGMMQLLPSLDGRALRTDRPVIGFSDATALFAAMHRRGRGPLVHAPVLHSITQTDEADIADLFALLRFGPQSVRHVGEAWREGRAEGPIVGGNLALLAALCGTPHQVDVRGSVLLIEEVGEHPFRVERMLTQLKLAGGLDGVAAVALGDIGDVPTDADYTWRDIVEEVLGPLGVPIVAGLPVGHRDRNQPFVWGTPASVDGAELRLTPPSPVG